MPEHVATLKLWQTGIQNELIAASLKFASCMRTAVGQHRVLGTQQHDATLVAAENFLRTLQCAGKTQEVLVVQKIKDELSKGECGVESLVAQAQRIAEEMRRHAGYPEHELMSALAHVDAYQVLCEFFKSYAPFLEERSAMMDKAICLWVVQEENVAELGEAVEVQTHRFRAIVAKMKGMSELLHGDLERVVSDYQEELMQHSRGIIRDLLGVDTSVLGETEENMSPRVDSEPTAREAEVRVEVCQGEQKSVEVDVGAELIPNNEVILDYKKQPRQRSTVTSDNSPLSQIFS